MALAIHHEPVAEVKAYLESFTVLDDFPETISSGTKEVAQVQRYVGADRLSWRELAAG